MTLKIISKIYQKAIICLSFLLLIHLGNSCKQKPIDATASVESEVDSVGLWIDQFNKEPSESIQRKELLTKAYNANQFEESDSIKNLYLVKIAYRAYKINDSLFFKKVAKEALNLSIKLNDSYRIGLAHSYYGFFI